MSITLENCGIVRDDILNGIVNKLTDQLEGDIYSEILKLVRNKVTDEISRKVETTVDAAINAKISELMASEIQPLNLWGEKRGEPRTINDLLSESLSSYWSTKVDRNGEPSGSYSATDTRADYIVKKIAADVLSDSTKNEFNQIILNTKAALSDSLANAVKKIADNHMGIQRKAKK